MYNVTVKVFLREGISDPEGHTIADAARSLGHETVRRIEAGRVYRLSLDVQSSHEAVELAEALGQRLLSNPVIQRFIVEDAVEECAS